MQKPFPVALLLGDLHLCHERPSCRNDEDWYDVMTGYIRQVIDFTYKMCPYSIPFICSGDIFDKWNSPIQLVNSMMKEFRGDWYAIPGQHDLPYHDYQKRHKAAYGNLVLSRVIHDLPVDKCTHIVVNGCTLNIFASPWEQFMPGAGHKKKGELNILVAHRYIWKDKHCYQNAPAVSNVDRLKKDLQGYDAAVFGDNHKGFLSQAGTCNVLNNGTFMRRKRDEIDYRPHVGILNSDGAIVLHYLDTSKDEFTTVSSATTSSSFEGLVHEMLQGSCGLDYPTELRRYMKDNETSKKAKTFLLQSIE